MPPSRKQAALSDVSSSTILPRPRGRPRKDGNVSLSSTVGAPTPARRPAASSSSSASARSRDIGNISLASTLGPSTPAQPIKKRGRPSKSSLTTPAMRALASADTSVASTSAAPRPRGRPPKSIMTTPGSRTLTSPNASVSFSDQPRKRGRPPKSANTSPSSSALPKKRGRPPKQAEADSTAATSVVTPRPRGRPPKSALPQASADMSASTSMAAPPKRRGRPPGSVNKSRASHPVLGLPKSRPEKRMRPAEEQDDTGSDVSLVDGVSEEESEASEGDPDQSDGEAEALSSADEASSRPRRTKSKKRKGWPSERERLRKWRRLSVEERECITSEGGLIWRTAIPLLNSMPKNIRSMVADSLTRALNRIDAKLEANLVPPLPRIPLGGGPTTLISSAATRRDLASSMLSWRLEEEGSLLRAENPDAAGVMSLGMNAEITELEQMLLPEAEQIVELSKTLEHQAAHLDRSKAEIAKLKRDRKETKSAGNTDYPPNLEAHDLLSITAHKPGLDPALASSLRLAERP